MTAYTGTIELAGKNGEVGQLTPAVGTYTLGGAVAAADTITWTNLLPAGDFRVVGVLYSSPELDTNATPTGTIQLGDGTDADAYLATINVGKPAQAPANGSQLCYMGNGVAIGTVLDGSKRNVVLTFVGVMATSATTGTIRVMFLLDGVR